jgi:alpha-glucosidase
MIEVLAGQPWRSSVSGLNLLGSHDTSRFRSVCRSAAAQLAGAGLLYTFPGIPMVFAGDEVGLEGVGANAARRPMPWDGSPWDRAVYDGYVGLAALRRRSRALCHGGLRWVHVGEDVLVYLRESRDQRVLVQISRDAHEEVVIDHAMLDGEVGDRWFGTGDVRTQDGYVVLPAHGPAVHIWEVSDP